MAFVDADVTIRPGENGGPAMVILDDSYKPAQGSQYARAGTQSTGFSTSYFTRGEAFNLQVTTGDTTPRTFDLDTEGQLARRRKYHAIVEAIRAGRGVKEDNDGTVGGAILYAIGNAGATTSAAHRTAKPAPIAVLAVDDDDDPAIPTKYLGKDSQTLGFGSIKVLT